MVIKSLQNCIVTNIVWKHCTSMDYMTKIKSYCPEALHHCLPCPDTLGTCCTRSSSFPPCRGTSLTWGKGSVRWWVSTETWPSPLPRHDQVRFVRVTTTHLGEIFCCWCIEKKCPWALPEQMDVVVHNAVQLGQKNTDTSSQHVSCVFFRWMTNSASYRNTSHQKAFPDSLFGWWAVVSVALSAGDVSHSLLFLQNRGLGVALSLSLNQDFLWRVQIWFFFP